MTSGALRAIAIAMLLVLSAIGGWGAPAEATSGFFITRFAGTGVGGWNGDGGQALATDFNDLSGMDVDRHGNLYVADPPNNRVRKIDANGVVTTVAGTGTGGFSGDGGLATANQLNYPYSVIVDGNDNLYIADIGSARIRKVDAAGIMTTVAGS